VRENQKAAGERPDNRRSPRPTIGLLTYGAEDPNSCPLWEGVYAATQTYGANLLCFPGKPLHSRREFDAQANVLYDLVGVENVDGLVIWGTSLATNVNTEEVRAFCERCHPLPIVNVGMHLEGIPSVFVDNCQGMRDVVTHLIQIHGCRRIAFIRGPERNPESKERYRAYEAALAESGIFFDSSLVVPGDWRRDSGAAAISLLLDERKADFEAVVADNDVMALEAMEALQAQGVPVPSNVAVVGFDDAGESRYSMPPLTTVRQSFFEYGQRAAEMLLALLEGREVPDQVILPLRMIVRQSCGCPDPVVVQAKVEPVTATKEAFKTVLTTQRESILSEMENLVEPVFERLSAERLLDAFVAELEGGSIGAFLSVLNEVLHQVFVAGGDVAAWQGGISVLRCRALSCLADDTLCDAENLFQQARVLIGETAQRTQAYRRHQEEQEAETLREVSETLNTTFEMADLTDVLAQKLPQLGIRRAYLSLYENPKSPAEWSRLILAYDERGCVELEPGGRRFASRQLVPEDLLPGEGRHSMVVEPLYFREHQIGFLLCEANPRQEKTCEAVRSQLSSALQRALLVQQVQEGQESLRSLYEASSVIISLQDPQKILEEVIERACEAVGAWHASIVLVDEEGHWQRLTREDNEPTNTDTLARFSSIALEVVRSGERLLIHDVYRHVAQASSQQSEEEIRAVGCFPLWLRARCIGVTWVYYKEPHYFSDTEVDALQLYVNQAAIAYDNARRMRELKCQRQAVEKLDSVAGVQEVLQQIVKSARVALRADSVVIWPYDAVRQAFLLDELVGDGVDEALLNKYVEGESHPGGTAATVIQKGYLAVTDVGAQEYIDLASPARGLQEEIGVKSFQRVALQVEGEPLAMMYVNYSLQRLFDEEDKSTLEVFAYHAALALKKARLLEQVKRAHETVQVVAQVSVLEDLQRTLEAIAKGTQDTLHCDAVTLYTYDQAKDEIGFPPAMVGVKHRSEVLKFGLVARDSLIRSILARVELHVAEDAPSDTLVGGPFVRREGIKSSVSIPLQVGDHKVGVMFVNYRKHHRFTGDELADINLFADQAAVAIRNAQLYEETSQRAQALEVIDEAGKALVSTLNLDEILRRTVEKAQKLVGPKGKPSLLSTVALMEGNELKAKVVCRQGHRPKLKGEEVLVADLEREKHIGIMGRAVVTAESQLVGDVTQDSDYIEHKKDIRSELAVPIKIGDRVIGAINVEHPDLNAFGEEDRQALEAMAAQAALAIQNARIYEELQQRYQDLEQIKGLIGSLTALDWIRMVSTAWGHSIRREVGIALVCAELAKQAHRRGEYKKALAELEDLEATVQRIRNIPIIAPLSIEDAVSSVKVNRIVRSYLRNLWGHPQYEPVHLDLDLQPDLDDLARVRASEEWLRRGLEIVIENAVQAMRGADNHPMRLLVITRLVGDRIEILVSDTGPGIPDEIMDCIFEKPIEKLEGSTGAGLGLALARNIFETYRGSIAVQETGPSGTVIAISLPIEGSKR
jgi:DNA-binding LacI/PurR family transcriptional regulator/GAF domain-containing protein